MFLIVNTVKRELATVNTIKRISSKACFGGNDWEGLPTNSAAHATIDVLLLPWFVSVACSQRTPADTRNMEATPTGSKTQNPSAHPLGHHRDQSSHHRGAWRGGQATSIATSRFTRDQTQHAQDPKPHKTNCATLLVVPAKTRPAAYAFYRIHGNQPRVSRPRTLARTLGLL